MLNYLLTTQILREILITSEESKCFMDFSKESFMETTKRRDLIIIK